VLCAPTTDALALITTGGTVGGTIAMGLGPSGADPAAETGGDATRTTFVLVLGTQVSWLAEGSPSQLNSSIAGGLFGKLYDGKA
jgi:hypothetical protein